MSEKIVEVKLCKKCNSNFEITDKDLEFYEKVSPTFNNKKYNIPTPNLCPLCREQRRLSFRNERKLYKRKCDATGKDIISIYSPDKPYKIYSESFYESDKWDSMDYGLEFDFNKPFFKQFENLLINIPKANLHNFGNQNCEYVNGLGNSDSCYLIFSGMDDEKCFYGRNIRKSFNCFDNSQIINSSFLYECSIVSNSNNVSFSFNISDCRDSYFLFDCTGCSNCFGCINLKNKQYYIYNEKYSKEEYFRIIGDLNLGNYDNLIKLKNKVSSFYKSSPHKNLYLLNNQGECSYNFISNSKDVLYSFSVNDSENIKYSFELQGSNDMYDSGISSFGCNHCLEVLAIGKNSVNNCFSTFLMETSNAFYSTNSTNSSNLFGCIGLKNKQYCILNKQYTKKEYELLVPKIIEHMINTGEWGEFFPSSISPFGYNETVANEYYPLSKEGVISKGFKYSDYEPPLPKTDRIIPANKLPDDVKDTPDDILNRAIECEITKKPFRIISQELEFYKKHNLPIPRRHPDQRHLDRMIFRNQKKLFDKKCNKCKIDIKTIYNPNEGKKIYCEECYNKEFY